jgi:hypothetical protein
MVQLLPSRADRRRRPLSDRSSTRFIEPGGIKAMRLSAHCLTATNRRRRRNGAAIAVGVLTLGGLSAFGATEATARAGTPQVLDTTGKSLFSTFRSSDGQYLAYTFVPDGTVPEAYTLKLVRATDGQVSTVATNLTTNSQVAFAGVGAATRLIYISNERVQSMPVAGGATTPLTPLLPAGTSLAFFVVSDNEASIAATASSGGLFGTNSVYAAAVAGPAATSPISVRTGPPPQLALSANGERVVHQGTSTGAVGSAQDLFVSTLAGSATLVDTRASLVANSRLGDRFLYRKEVVEGSGIFETRLGSFTGGPGPIAPGFTAGGTVTVSSKDPSAEAFIVNEGLRTYRVGSLTGAFASWTVTADQVLVADGSLFIARRVNPASPDPTQVLSRAPLTGGTEAVIAPASALVTGIIDVSTKGDLLVDQLIGALNNTTTPALMRRSGGIDPILDASGQRCLGARFSATGDWIFASCGAQEALGSGNIGIVSTAGTGPATAVEAVTECNFLESLESGLFICGRGGYDSNGRFRATLSSVRSAWRASPPAIESLVPKRLLDSRPRGSTFDGQFAGGGLRAAGSTLELTVAGRGGIPAGARSALLNVTATDAAAAGYVTAYPCGEPVPNASNLNYVAGKAVPNLVSVKIGANGKVCLFVSATTHLIADASGFVPDGSTFGSVSPARVLDSRAPKLTVDSEFSGMGERPSGSITPVTVTGRAGVPSDATSAMLNVTAANAKGGGYLTVFPCGEAPPNASNLNFIEGGTTPNAVLAKVGASGQVCIFTSAPTQLIIDVNGFTRAGAGLAPVSPRRLLDSRGPGLTVDGLQSGGGKVVAGSVTKLKVLGRGGVPSTATTALLNVTVDDAVDGGYLTVFPCGEAQPDASNVNFLAGDTVANAVLAKIGVAGEVCVFSFGQTHLIVDVNGFVAN